MSTKFVRVSSVVPVLSLVLALAVFGCDEESRADSAGVGGSAGFGGWGATGGSAGVGATGGDAGFGGTGGDAGFGATGGDAGLGATGGDGGMGGIAGSAGIGGIGGIAGSAGTGGSQQPNTAPGFMNLAPQMGAPFTENGDTALTPPAPAGWKWFPVEGTRCRDGSPNGLFVHWGTAPKLLIYLEGGGACINQGFCDYNPKNKDFILTGTGETVIGSAFGSAAGRQQPGAYEGGVAHGLHDFANSENPYKDWSHVYIPYCTGDVHFGTRENSMVPGVTEPQQFVGYRNMQKFVGRIVPTFKDSVDQVVITGASAGSFGAALNFSMVQDAFGSVRVFPILDSGVPFEDSHWPACMQKTWREIWGLNAALPADCDECFQADGGGMMKLADFLLDKHPNARLAVISGLNDEVIRLFFSPGLQNCATITSASPIAITLGQFDPNVYIPAAEYEASLRGVKAAYMSTNRMSTYFIGGFTANLHQHTFRNRFYEAAAGGKTIAAFVTGYLNDEMQHIE